MKPLLLFLCLAAYGQIAPSSQWIVPNGQYVPGRDLDCVRPANTFMFGPSLNLVVNQATSFCEGGPYYAGQTQTFTTGVVVAKTFNFLYGVVKVRALFPPTGVHGGLWMLDARCQTAFTSGGYGYACPTATELDIYDFVPQWTSGRGTCAYWLTNGTNAVQTVISTDPAVWHVYSLIWTSSSLTWQVDGSTVCTFGSSPNVAMFPMLSTEMDNINSDRASSYPITMFVDYERICSDPTSTCAPGDPTMIFQDEFPGNTTAISGTTTISGQVVVH
jgi:beta-glucanase (GH16 family)